MVVLHSEKKTGKIIFVPTTDTDNTSGILHKEVAYCQKGLWLWNWKFIFWFYLFIFT